jgi:hypothetical protein
MNLAGPRPEIFAILAEALARHIKPEIGAFVNLVFSLQDHDELRQLMSRAGFPDAAIQHRSRILRLPAPREFLWQYVRCTPLADAVAQASDERRAALERDVVAKWQRFVENGALILEGNIPVVTARK